MAIKGKKKSQSRGSQSRRRPAAAPRAIATSRRRTPWYKTPQGRAGIIAFLLVVAGVITGFVIHAHSNSTKLADRQDAIERYTASVRAVLQTMTPAASEMVGAPTDASDKATVAPLTKSAADWQDTLNAAIDETGTLRPPPSAAQANALFQQSVGLYLNAAQLYALVPDANSATAAKLLTSASGIRDQANELWANAVSLIDEVRSGIDMTGSGLRSPATAPPNGQPTPAPIQTDITGGGGGKKKGSKNGK